MERVKMTIVNKSRQSRMFFLVCGLALLLVGTSIALGQQANNQQTPKEWATNVRPVPSGSKMKFKGVVIRRDADTFTIRDTTRTDYQVLLTDDSSIKTYGGFFKGG